MHVVALPMLQGDYVDRLLSTRSVPHRFWDRAKVAHGVSPMPHREARTALRGYYDVGVYSVAPVVVESSLDAGEMHGLVASLRDDPGFAAYVADAMPDMAADSSARRSLFCDDMDDEGIAELEAYGDLLDAMFVTDTR